MFSPEQKRLLELLEVECKGDQEFMRAAQNVILDATTYHWDMIVKAHNKLKEKNDG